MIQAFPSAQIWFFQTWGLIGPCTAPGLCFLCKYSLQNFNKSALVCHTGRLMTNHIIFPLHRTAHNYSRALSKHFSVFVQQGKGSGTGRDPPAGLEATLSSIIWGKCPFLPFFSPPIHDKILELILPRGFMQSHEPTTKGYLNSKGKKGGAQPWKKFSWAAPGMLRLLPKQGNGWNWDY